MPLNPPSGGSVDGTAINPSSIGATTQGPIKGTRIEAFGANAKLGNIEFGSNGNRVTFWANDDAIANLQGPNFTGWAELNLGSVNVNGTYTSSTVYERLSSKYDSGSGAFVIGTEKGASGGSARALGFAVDGTTTMAITLTGAISGQTPDNTATGGNARGTGSLDLQRARAAANQVAENDGAVILTGENNRVTSPAGAGYGKFTTVASGFGNTINALGNGSLCAGQDNILTGDASFGTIFVLGNNNNVNAGDSNGPVVTLGELHIGGGANCSYLGGFHNWADGRGVGAQGNTIKRSGLGGLNMTLMGAGVAATWQGANHYTGHGNKDRDRTEATLTRNGTTVANGATLDEELFLMAYPPTCSFLPAAINTTTNVITCANSYAANTVARMTSTGTLPAPLLVDTDYYVVNPTGSNFQLSLTSGGAAIDLTTQGTGLLHTFNPATNYAGPKWMRLLPRRIYTIEFELLQALVAPTTPAYSIRRFRGNWYQPVNWDDAPVLIGSVTAIESVGSNAGSPPAGWGYTLSETKDGLHLVGTIVNADGATRATTQFCHIVSVSMLA